jgi:hypothetical protein
MRSRRQRSSRRRPWMVAPDRRSVWWPDRRWRRAVPRGRMRALPIGLRRAERGTVLVPVHHAHAPHAHYGGSASCLAAVCPPPRPSAASCRLGPPPAPSLRSWRGAAHGGGGPAGSRPIASKTASAGGFRSIPRPSPCAGPRVLIARFPVCNAVPAPVRATGPLVAPMSRPAGRCAGPAARSIVTPSGGLRCHGGPAAAWMRAVVVGMGDPPRCA